MKFEIDNEPFRRNEVTRLMGENDAYTRMISELKRKINKNKQVIEMLTCNLNDNEKA